MKFCRSVGVEVGDYVVDVVDCGGERVAGGEAVGCADYDCV